MKTRQELNLYYWGEWHDKCKGTALEGKEWLGVKFYGEVDYCGDHPSFDCDPDYYEIAMAVLEDKAVFDGAVLYDSKGDPIVVHEGINLNWKYFSWTPPTKHEHHTVFR